MSRRRCSAYEVERRQGLVLAVEFIRDALADGLPHPQKEVVDYVTKTAEVSKQTVHRASRALGVDKTKTEARDVLGHSSVTVTEVYVHPNRRALRSGMADRARSIGTIQVSPSEKAPSRMGG